MEPLWYLIGFILSALLGAQLRKPFALGRRRERPPTKEQDRYKEQWDNLLSYDGSVQEDEE